MSKRPVNKKENFFSKISKKSRRSRNRYFEDLECRRLLAADIEPNNTIAEAVVLGSGNQLHVDPMITPTDSSDWYRWTATGTGTVRVDVLFSHAQADLGVKLTNSAGTVLASSDTITDNERVSTQVIAGQNVYINVSSCTNPLGNCDGAGVFGTYTLKITEVRPDALEGGSGNNQFGSATNFGGNNQSISDLTIHSFDDQDYFRFVAPTNGVLNAGILFENSEGDLDLFAYNAFGELLVSSQSESNDEQLNLDVQQGNEYFLRVLEVHGREQPGYDLNVSFVSPPQISGLPAIVSGFTLAPTTIPFTVTDGDDPIDSLVFIGASNDPSVVPNSGITFGGSGSNRTVTITPKDVGFNTIITITVNDLRGGIAEGQFRFSQFTRPPSNAPFISPIGAKTISEDSSTGPIGFILSDDNTAVGGLTVIATSSDTDLIPNGNISVTKATPNSTITVTPAADRVGTALITIEAIDLDGMRSQTSFPVTVTPVDDPGSNDPPTFNLISDQSINEDSGAHSLVITGVGPGGVGEGGQTVTLSATSDNPLLINPSISGTTLNFTPAPNRFGTARITVKAQDNGGGADTYRQSFNIVVNNVNDSPTMSNLTDDFITAGSPVSDVDFTIGDLETPPSLLSVTAFSGNTTLIPNSNITFTGTGTQRTILVTPAPGQTGSAAITVTVSDGDKFVSDTYTVFVTSSNDPPNLSGVVDQTINEDATAPQISFSVGDEETDPNNLTVAVVSSNQSLIPNANLNLGGSGAIRTLNIAPLPNQSGTATITISVLDNGDPPMLATDSFDVIVRPVNDRPSFTAGGNQTTLENAGPQNVAGWATNISPGPGNESSQTVSFNVTNNNPGLFLIPPAVSPTGNLTYTPASGSIGSASVSVTLTDNGGTANGGSDTSAAQTFTITIGSVNDEPTFVEGSDQTVAEDSGLQTVPNWATNISPGPGESNQNVSFHIVSNSNTAMFSSLPAISPTGTLTYAAAPNANGTATITVELKDDGGTTNGGDDTSDAQSFVITVTPVNDRPSFTIGPDQSVGENAGIQTIANWATGISPGPADELGQTVSFMVTGNSAPSLFSVPPTITSAGRLTFTPAQNASGSATITVVLTDNGGGTDTSNPQTFNITVGSVNDPPSFAKGSDETALEDAGAQSIPNWATNISPGPNESNQNVTFELVGNNNPALFAVAPAISPTGQLSYTPAANAYGSAVLTIRLRDDGGTANNGNDVSPSQAFGITVLPVNDAPSFTKGADQAVQEGATAVTIPNWATNISAGPANEADQQVSFTILSNDNPNLFSVAPAVAANGTLTFTPTAGASGAATISLRAADDGGTLDGGTDISAPQTFTISVASVNNEPTFVKGPDQSIREDSGPHAIANWATSIDAGGADESGQQLTFKVVSNTNPGLFATQPAISAGGELTYALTPNAFGFAAVTVELMDDGGTANGGDNTSPAQTVTFNVIPVNDAPTFTNGENVSLSEDPGAVTLPGWATNISAGPGEEDQSLAFTIIGNSRPELFDVPPSVSANGTLSFTVKPETSGTATLGLQLKDNGGTVNGGQDSSIPQSFTISVNTDNDLPVISAIDDQVFGVGLSKQLAFTVSDVETAADELVVTATSSNPSVIPNGNITLGGSGGNRTVRVNATNVAGSAAINVSVNDGEATVTETFNVTIVDNASPVVLFTKRNDGLDTFDTVTSLAFAFSENVGASIDASDLVLIDSNKGTQPNLGLVSVSYDTDSDTARFDLSNVALPLGRYIATLRGNAISDADGNNLDGNLDGNGGDDYLEIMVLTYSGDANLDLKVDFSDFLRVSSSFGTSGQSWQSGDFTGDGVVDFSDFLKLSANFGKEGAASTGQGSVLGGFFGSTKASKSAAAAAAPSTDALPPSAVLTGFFGSSSKAIDSAFGEPDDDGDWWEESSFYSK